jgi:hypothetical protein
MDAAVEKILGAFEIRAATESEQMQQMDASKMGRHLDELLLSVGRATGQLINFDRRSDLRFARHACSRERMQSCHLC